MSERPNLVLADPPWFYNRRRNVRTRFGGGLWRHYEPMRTPEIAALPVAEHVDPRSVLFLWATMPRLPDALQVMRSWGFQYVTNAFTWVKVDRQGKPRFLPGQYTASNVEVCLLGRRGRAMLPVVDDVSSVVLAPLGEHSAKPEEVRRRIERLYPEHRKLELFSRREADGWITVGNHLSGLDIRAELPALLPARD